MSRPSPAQAVWPKGAGALYVRRKNPRVQLVAQIDGGGHERGMRSGTLNVPGIAGLGKACAIAQEEMPQESRKIAGLRDRLKDSIMSRLDEVYINGSVEHRLPGNLNISFAYVEGESLLMGINDIAVSSGSHAPRDTGTILCIKSARHGRRSGAQLDPLRHWAFSTPRPRSITWPTAWSKPCCVCANYRRSTKWRKRVWT